MENKVHVLRQLLRQRWRLSNWVVLVYLAAVVITCVWITIVDGFIKEAVLGVTMGYGFFAGCALFILLAIDQEHVWVGSRYRLAPVADTKLYILNVLASFLGFLYGAIIGTAVMGISAIPYLNRVFSLPHTVMFVVSGGFLLMSVCLYSWIFISMVHLVGATISAFLPPMRQKIVTFVFYVLVIILVIVVLNGFENGIEEILPNYTLSFSHVNAIKDAVPAFFAGGAILLLQAALYSVVNVLMLHNWVETKQA